MRYNTTFIDGSRMRDSISRFKNKSGCLTRRKKSQKRLIGQIKGGSIKLIKHDFNHALTILFGVPRNFIINLIYFMSAKMDAMMVKHSAYYSHINSISLSCSSSYLLSRVQLDNVVVNLPSLKFPSQHTVPSQPCQYYTEVCLQLS